MSSYIRPWACVTALLTMLCVAVPPGAAADTAAEGRAASGQRAGASRAAYWSDKRFLVELNLEAIVLDGELLLRMMEREVGAQLMMQGDWLKKPIGLTVKKIKAAELMDALAVLLGGRWQKVGEVWVLAVSSQRAQNAARLYAKQRRAASRFDERLEREADRLLDLLIASFTPQQWAKLEAGDKLVLEDLSPDQWRLLRESMLCSMRDPTGPYLWTPRPEALQGRFYIRYFEVPIKDLDGTVTIQRQVNFWWANYEDGVREGIPGKFIIRSP